MSTSRRFIQNRAFLMGALAFCIYEVVASWHGMDRSAPPTYDVVTILVGTFVTIICAIVVARTSFFGDRAVIGPITIASFLWVVIDLALPNQQTVHILRGIAWSMWVISLIGGIFVFACYPRGWPVSGSPSEKQS